MLFFFFHMSTFSLFFVGISCIKFLSVLLMLLFFISVLCVLQVAEALFEITLPRFSGDILPETVPGIVLAIADR